MGHSGKRSNADNVEVKMANGEERSGRPSEVAEVAPPTSIQAALIRQLIGQAVQLHQAGRSAEATNLYRQVLALDAQQPDALHLLGVIAHQEGRHGVAVELIQKAIKINGTVAAYYSNLGNALQARDRLAEAAASYEAALRINAHHAEALSNLGSILPGLGRAEEAIASCEVALRIRPDYAEAFYNRGNAQHALGRLDEAVSSFVAALRVRPNFVEALCNLGNALADLGRLDEAVGSYDAALCISPHFAVALCNRGNALQNLGRAEEAIASYDAALRIKSDFVEALCNRGNALQNLGHAEEAVASYDAALRIRPAHAEALYNRANVLLALGRTEDALASYDAALCVRPDFVAAHLNLAMAKTYVTDDQYLPAMESAYRNPKTSEGERSHICFALGKANEDLGRYEESFCLYTEGNALQKKALGYSIDHDRALFSALRKLFTGIEPRQAPLPAISCAQRQIFIVGMPRSGTTLTEQILASHSQVYGAGELEAMTSAVKAEFDPDGQGFRSALTKNALAGIRRRYLFELGELKTSKPVISDKMPLNFRWIGFILEAMPEVRVVNLVRDPIAVCWSLFKRYFPAEGLGFANDLGDLIAFYRLYDELMAFWRARYPGRIYDLDYEALTEDQEGQTRALLDHCGLPWEDDCLDFHRTQRVVGTASATQVRRRMYKGSSQAWRKFEPYLGSLIEAFPNAGGPAAASEPSEMCGEAS